MERGKNKNLKKSEEKLIQKMPETIAEVKLRHAKIARIMQQKAIHLMQKDALVPKTYQDLRVAITLEREALGLNDKRIENELYEKLKPFAFLFSLSEDELKLFVRSAYEQCIALDDKESKEKIATNK